VPINVRDAISNALTMFGAQLKSRGINLDFTYGNEELRALASVNQLGQVIINCVTNARDALSETGQANKQISIDAYRDDGKVYITISDNGPGMPPEVREQLFTPFFTTKEPGKGTGLGMSISQKLVEGFGGRIMCDSTPGKGTTIIIVLEEPAAEAEQAAGAG
jgi:C4-dicarboxylate-specific signal transduction histidine kinase